MDKKFLLESANKLNVFSEKTAQEYLEKTDQLVAMLNQEMLNRKNIEKIVGSENLEMMKDNHRNHTKFIYSIIKNFDENVLVETVLWVFRAYRSHGFDDNYWSILLSSFVVAIEDIFTLDAKKEILPLYDWMLINIPLFIKVTDNK